MRITLIVPGGVGADGVRRVIPALLALIARLAARHNVLVIALDQTVQPASYRLCGAEVLCLGTSGGPIGRLAKLLAACAAFRPQIIQSFWLGSTSTFGALAARMLRVPLLAHLGGGELVDLPQIGYGGRRSARTRLHVGLALRSAACVSAGSQYALGPLLAHRPTARWLPLGVEIPPMLRRNPARPPRLLQIASINRVKGPDVLLAALDFLRDAADAQLHWIGEDTLGGAIQAQAARMRLAAQFPGWRAHDQLAADRAVATLYVQSSYHESQGVAVLEAAAAGLPLIGSAVGILAELAPHAAVATPAGDGVALGRALAALLNDPARQQALAAAARDWAATYDADWTAAQFEQVYMEQAR